MDKIVLIERLQSICCLQSEPEGIRPVKRAELRNVFVQVRPLAEIHRVEGS